MITDLQVQHELLKTALEATDNYLFLEKRAKEAGMATSRVIHDFTYEMSRAHDALQALGVLDKHQDYMEFHVQEMLKLIDRPSATIAEIPFLHVPAADFGEVEESVSISELKTTTLKNYIHRAAYDMAIKSSDKASAASSRAISSLSGDEAGKEKADKERDVIHKKIMNRAKGISTASGKLKEETPVWDKKSPVKDSTPLSPDQKAKAKARAKAAGRPYPNMVDNIWAARQESTIVSFKDFLTEEKKRLIEVELSDEEINQIVDEMTWEDIVDLYDDIELTYEKDDDEPEDEDEKELKEDFLDEKLSVQSRLKKRQAFARMRGKRNVARNIKLRRASSIEILKKRAVVAARRAVYKRFLRGRDKSSLSAAEKDRIEQQVARMKYMQQAIATKMLPKMRSIEQKRLAGYRTRKSSAPGGTKSSKAPGGTKAPKRK